MSNEEQVQLAEVQGVGCSYVITADEMFAVFTVSAQSGPSAWIVQHTADTFRAAMTYVLDEIDADLNV